MSNERRLFARMPAKVIADCSRYRDAGNSREHLLSFTRDISVGGVCLILPRAIRVGELILLHLELPTHFIGPLIRSEVVWICDRNVRAYEGRKEREVIESGLNFLSMDSIDSKKLRSFILELRKADVLKKGCLRM